MTHPQSQGFFALPPAGTGPGVLVLHAWWGLNDTLKAFCARLAGEGFVAFAPDLYHGAIAATIAEAEVLGGAIDANPHQAQAEVAAAAAFLGAHTGGAGFAVVAFSLGGYFALKLADADPAHVRSVVLFYGTDGGYGGDFSQSRATYLGHFAGLDKYEPPSNADMLEATLKRAGRTVTFHRYSGVDHWFFEPDVTQAYDKAAADLAWERTLAFLKRPSAG